MGIVEALGQAARGCGPAMPVALDLLCTRSVHLWEASDFRFCGRLQFPPKREAKLPPPMPWTNDKRFYRHCLNSLCRLVFDCQTLLGRSRLQRVTDLPVSLGQPLVS